MVVDRRRADRDRRTGSRVAAVFAVKNKQGRRVQLGQAEDIGPGGMTLRRPKDAPFPPETPICLSFELPGGDPIAVDGVVVRDQGAGRFRRTGVRFTSVTPEQERILTAWCSRGTPV